MDSSLTFDGVFEMAPHPMYSLGYVGYYGISLITKSYIVAFVSILAHVSQLVFLVLVEEPRNMWNLFLDIKKTYETQVESPDSNMKDIRKHYFHRDLIFLLNFDMLRSADGLLLVSTFYLFITFFYANSFFLFFQALFWRCMFSFGLGWILSKQSHSQFYTSHFDNVTEAFHHWKTLYNFCMVMTNVSFFVAAAHFYVVPNFLEDWAPTLIRHLFGLVVLI
jgi:phosphatidylethanolamine N-methyltransferase